MIEHESLKDKMSKRTVYVTTLTPLWTGGIEATTDRVHETGVIGSLRWWYEAIVRGLGHKACDPTASKEENSCSACKLFGYTGSKRKFSMNIITDRNPDEYSVLNIRPYGRSRGWFLPPGFTGDITIHLHGKEDDVDQIVSLIHWLSSHGSIGARPQLGYGVFKVQRPLSVKSFNLHILNEIPGENQPRDLPDLRSFTFFKFHFVPRNENWWKTIRNFHPLFKDAQKLQTLEELAGKNMIPVSPLLKDYFRFKKEWKSFKTTKWLFGAIERGRKQRSRINFSWAYKVEDQWEVRGWAWLPYWGESRYWYREVVNGLKDSVGDETEWLKALDLKGKVSEAKVYIEPKKSPWETKDTDTVMKWLKGGGA
jgi:CRISPR-associated protein Cmr1